MTHHDKDQHRPTPLWGSILTVIAGVTIIALAATVIHYRDLYGDTLDDLRKAEFRRKTLEEDSSNFRYVQRDKSAYTLQLIPTLTQAETTAFQARGLRAPYDDLAADLVNNWDSLGRLDRPSGSHDSLVRDAVCVLGPDRALALFDDGDRHGTALLAYRVSESGEITWQLLETVVQ
ncbi:MAG: hypothetical protein OEV49_01225 [candidate division Zixibacteria bacterium]|nr:hypothetical protein [candidate division Zixibacteria bacterium]MDH3937188.1 hypothetical protein [candidate division Zixibacteria bacterium]MDH4032451.1 hypothetical protein [candidate division Zixibacteria bacterium]